MRARVFVSLKPTVLDPQGQTIRAALSAHGHPGVTEVRQGKYFDITIAESGETATAKSEIEQIASGVLANPVIEDYRVEFLD